MSQDLSTVDHPNGLSDFNDSPSTPSSTSSLKRRASASFECPDDSTRKKMKEEPQDNAHPEENSRPGSLPRFVDEIAEELQCGCCSELVYRPVLVMPCQHFFCGSCCVLWIRNGGTSCPACRGAATVAMPFRSLQPILDTLLRNAPHKARTEREREQADEIYKAGLSIRVPPPKETSPPPDMNRSTEYVHPCPHCLPNNLYEWRCPQPIADPSNDIDHAWHIDDGVPPGHANCGNCENLLALQAPSTTRCDLCLVSFCGIGVQDRCVALPMLSQHPHSLSMHGDLIQSSEVYECFDGNIVEVEIMLEYLDNHRITPRHIYREIVNHIQKQPRGFVPLIELELYTDVHAVAPGLDPGPDAPRSRVCRMCAAETFLWGLKEWWVLERQKGLLEASAMNRKDCPDAGRCILQKENQAHAREFNHVFPSRVLDEPEANNPPEVPNAAPAAPMHPIDLPPPPPITAPGSSAASLSFLLNVDEDMDAVSPEFRSSTSDTRGAVDTPS
ncbi:hypothetical protein GALMADRAFT_238141 [Galerina marginata CBS 339.88]|uniref:RING-type domain-containing protein n=1 Tax=Galerina marginata (strain CBS 339.88) TaxID=685588 RepID=A0A067THH0_GALM3|nr:hypothetical protein GALMADRAFT_238141 [Galerina marginata CBS 339.88]